MMTFTHCPMNSIDAIAWCKRNRGTISFDETGHVTVSAYGFTEHGVTVGDAMTALRDLIAMRRPEAEPSTMTRNERSARIFARGEGEMRQQVRERDRWSDDGGRAP